MIRIPIKSVFLLLGASSLLFGSTSSSAAPSDDPGEIMQAVFDRETGDKIRAKMTMTIQSGRKRVRSFQVIGMDTQDRTKKQLMLFDAPAEVRNTGLLTFDYDDGSKDDDQWLYLPSMRKTTRISAGDKSGAFMGSDFTYSDMTRQSPEQYDYKMLASSVKVDGEDAWHIEARPKTDKAREQTGYVKSELWVSKEKLMPLRIKAWVRDGKKLKYIKAGNIEKIDGVWIARTMAAKTVRGKKTLSATILQIEKIKLNDSGVEDSDFTRQRLGQGL